MRDVLGGREKVSQNTLLDSETAGSIQSRARLAELDNDSDLRHRVTFSPACRGEGVERAVRRAANSRQQPIQELVTPRIQKDSDAGTSRGRSRTGKAAKDEQLNCPER